MAVTKDSGERQEFQTGARRDTEKGKPLFSAIPLDKLDAIQGVISGVSMFDTLDNSQPYEVGFNAELHSDIEEPLAFVEKVQNLIDENSAKIDDLYYKLHKGEVSQGYVAIQVKNLNEELAYAIRDASDEAGIIPPIFLSRLRGLLERGARKYTRNNYQQGIPLDRAVSSLERHLQQAKAGDTSEDHLAAVAFNTLLWMVTEYNVYMGKVPTDLLKGRWGAVANGAKTVRLHLAHLGNRVLFRDHEVS